MASEKRKSVKVYRGILGTMSGQLIGINFNKNNTMTMTPTHKEKEKKVEWYFVGGVLLCNKKTICGKVKARSCQEAEKKFIKKCDFITIICCRKIKVF